MWVQSLGWQDPLEKEKAPHSKLLPGNSHGQRSLVGYSPWGCKQSDTTEATEDKEGVRLSLSDYTARGHLLRETHAITFCSSSREEKEACRDPLKSVFPTFSPLFPSPTIFYQQETRMNKTVESLW